MAVATTAPVDPSYRKRVLKVIFVSLLLDLVWPASSQTFRSLQFLAKLEIKQTNPEPA